MFVGEMALSLPSPQERPSECVGRHGHQPLHDDEQDDGILLLSHTHLHYPVSVAVGLIHSCLVSLLSSGSNVDRLANTTKETKPFICLLFVCSFFLEKGGGGIFFFITVSFESLLSLSPLPSILPVSISHLTSSLLF